jgi:hypothetical protein
MAQQSQSATAPFDSLSWQQKVEFVQGIMLYPALTVMVFLRRKVGFRQLKPTRLIGMAALLMAFAYFSGNAPTMPFSGYAYGQQPAPASGGGIGLTIYAIAMLSWGLFQRRQRWIDLAKNGIRWQTRTTGLSYFKFLPVSTYIVHRFIDPLVCIIIGALVSIVSHPLGLWLMFSGAALGIFEQAVFEKALDSALDQLDCLVEAEVLGETVEHFTGAPGTTGQPSEKPLSIEETACIPTGLAPDIKRQIAIRQKRAPLSDTPIPPPDYSPGTGNAPAQADAAAPDEQEAPPTRHAPDNLASK